MCPSHIKQINDSQTIRGSFIYAFLQSINFHNHTLDQAQKVHLVVIFTILNEIFKD